jgi:type IV pilus assembly protein PilC
MAKNLAMAYHNLSLMLEAGVPLLRSLNTIASGEKPHVQKAFLVLADGVSQGDPLAETMGKNPKLFKPLDVMLVHAAETSGSLPDLIGLLSKWHETSRRMVKKLWSGMLFPIAILTIAALVIPLPNFILGGWNVGTYLFSVLMILLLFWIPAGLILLIIFGTPKTGFARRLLDHVVLRIPMLGRAMYRLAIGRYCWVFHMLCKAGVPVTDCVEMSLSATGNAAVGDLFRPAVERVRAGDTMGQGLSSKLPAELVEMWKIGEETGTLDDVTKRLAKQNTEAAEFWFAEFTRWFPRFVYGLVAVFMIISVFKGYSRIYSFSF